MAEETVQPLAESNLVESNTTAAEDMELETVELHGSKNGDDGSKSNGTESATNGDANSKRARDEDEDEAEESDCDGSKKLKVEKSMEEERLEKLAAEGGERKETPVSLGPKVFGSSVEMFDYFFKFLHFWPPKLNINKYEHLVLLDLLKKGHAEPEKKIGEGIKAFEVRYHPMWKSRCFFLIREDGSVDDFSFRKCVDQILPLPEHMKIKHNANKALGGGNGKNRGGRGGGGGRGRGRGGRSRN